MMISITFFHVCILYFLIPHSTAEGVNVTHSLRTRLDTEIFKGEKHSSVAVSPMAIHFAFCKLASAADRATRDQLLAALGYNFDKVMDKFCYAAVQQYLDELKRIDFIMFNKIFLSYNRDLNSSVVRGGIKYGADMEPIGFYYPYTAAKYINNMLDRTSLKRLDTVINGEEFGNDTSIVFLSAIYLKVTLESPFDVRRTKKTMFRYDNGTRTAVDMMMKIDSFRYLHEPETNVQFVTMRLASNGVSITFGVPYRSYGLTSLLHKLQIDPDFFQHVYKAMHLTDVKLRIPRFKIKTKIDLTNYIKKIGLHGLFNKTYSGLNVLNQNATVKPMYLSTVKQNCFVDFDELGLFRNTLDILRDSPRAFEETGIDVTADKPFYFSINLHEDQPRWYDTRPILTGVYRGPGSGWTVIQDNGHPVMTGLP